MDRPIRVLVVDDSAFMRKVLTDLLGQDPALTVVGTARDGLDALDKVESLSPDVVTLDVEMPRLDGLGTLRELMRRRPLPVVMVSSLTQTGAATTIQALAAGAVDFVGKPSGSISLDMARVAAELIGKVKGASRARPRISEPVSAKPLVAAATAAAQGAAPVPKARPVAQGSSRVVVIGCSTGGPGALHQVIPQLGPEINAGVLVVQHMPAGFTRSLADRLNDISQLEVREAQEGDLVEPGRVLIAPGDYHMLVGADRRIHLNQEPTLHGVRPAVDRTLDSVTPLYGKNAVAVIMTGMGYDGAKGVAALRRAGGRAIAQEESTCVVYGMPKVVVETGNADRIATLGQIPGAIREMLALLG